MNPESILQAMRATDIPPGSSGRWAVLKSNYDIYMATYHTHETGKPVPPGLYTWLRNTNITNLHMNEGEVVMTDTPDELKTHLNFALRAKGVILVTGLGLGCVVRGLLCNPNVTHITVVERCKHVLKLVLPYMPDDDRIDYVVDDAKMFVRNTKQLFDYAWHDLWSDPDMNEGNLSLTHFDLMKNLRHKAHYQGCWGIAREFRGYLKRQGFWYENS